MTTVEDSVLCTEMGALESQEEDAPKRVLWYKPMAFWGVIRPHHRDEVYTLSTTISVISAATHGRSHTMTGCVVMTDAPVYIRERGGGGGYGLRSAISVVIHT